MKSLIANERKKRIAAHVKICCNKADLDRFCSSFIDNFFSELCDWRTAVAKPNFIWKHSKRLESVQWSTIPVIDTNSLSSQDQIIVEECSQLLNQRASASTTWNDTLEKIIARLEDYIIKSWCVQFYTPMEKLIDKSTHDQSPLQKTKKDIESLYNKNLAS